MIEMVQAFIKSVSERKHVLLLIENEELTIDFIMKEKIISIALKNGQVYMTEEADKSTNRYRIIGEYAKLKELVEGREKLRPLIKRGDLQLSASFRITLLLEAFFYLGKTEPLLAKIS